MNYFKMLFYHFLNQRILMSNIFVKSNANTQATMRIWIV